VFSHKTALEKPELLSEGLVGGVTEVATVIMEQMERLRPKLNNFRSPQDEIPPPAAASVVLSTPYLTTRSLGAAHGANNRETVAGWILNSRAASAAVLSPFETILLISACC
jgi:hypothetical protein